jgi:hypothetical protein
MPYRERLPLPVLENLRIASPCNADWAAMPSLPNDDRVRYCMRCEQNVYDLSALSRAEAETLIAAKQGRLCVGYYQRADGTILTRDCTVGARQARVARRFRVVVTGAVVALFVVGAAAGVAAQKTERVFGGVDFRRIEAERELESLMEQLKAEGGR